MRGQYADSGGGQAPGTIGMIGFEIVCKVGMMSIAIHHDLPRDAIGARVQIDCVPTKTEQLGAADAGYGVQHEGSKQVARACRLKQSGEIIR